MFTVSCSTKRNTFVSRQYHNFTTHYNVYFNGKESLREGEEKIKKNHKEVYSYLLPLFFSDDDVARKSAYSNMERAVIKAQKAIKLHSITRKPRRKNNKRHKKDRNKKEFNIYIDDCYLLIAKGSFYNKKYNKADKSLVFLTRNFEGTPIVKEAKIWYVRSLVDQGKFIKAKTLIEDIGGIKGLSSDLREMYFKVIADFKIKSGDINGAIEDVESLVNVANGRKDKIRYRFILAQLFLKAGLDDVALRTFSEISKMRVSYDMAFNASINMAMAYNGTNGGGVRRTMKKLLRDSRNRLLKDQIYYALANIEFKDGNIEKGIEYLKNSTKTSIDNDIQKSLSYRILADYYYENKDYRNAYVCYDSCLYFNDTRVVIDNEVLRRKNDLADLVGNMNVVYRQDSLQRLALLTPRKREELIQNKINKVKRREEKLQQVSRDAQLDKSFYLQNGLSSKQTNSFNSKGDWYFYNPVSLSMGRSEFVRKWGRRKREDNWRRKNKAVVDVFHNEGGGKYENERGNNNSKNDLKSKSYYLKDIPVTEKAKAISDSLIVDALFSAAEILKEKFSDYEKSLSTYEDLINRYPQNKYLIYTYYNSYSISNIIRDYGRSSNYKKMLINKFPESRYAKMLNDPDYLLKCKRGLLDIEKMYEKAYKFYSNYSFIHSIAIIDKALAVYPKSGIVDRLLMLKALCIGRVSSKNDFVKALKEVLLVNPDKEIRSLVDKILDAINKGAIPEVYGSEDVVRARSLRNSREWDFTDYANPMKKEMVRKRVVQLYDADEDDDFYVVLSVPRRARNINRLKFHINYITEELIEQGEIEVWKEQIGGAKTVFVVKGLKDRGEAERLVKVLSSSRKIRSIVGKQDYNLFYISSSNYKVLHYNQDIDVYLDFFKDNYKIDAEVRKENKPIQDGSFIYDESKLHCFVIVYPSGIDSNNLKKGFKKYNVRGLGVYLVTFGEGKEILKVTNLKNKDQAMTYLEAVVTNRNLFEVIGERKYRNFIISEQNLRILIENHELKEYLEFFKKWYLNR